MAENLIDSEAGTELFGSYEAELKLVQADLNQKLEQIPELTGEPRKAAIGHAERAVGEAKEIVCSLSPNLSRTRVVYEIDDQADVVREATTFR